MMSHTDSMGAAAAALSCITFKYVAGHLARLILPLYNVYELAVQYSPLENRIGTFLVTFGTKAV